MEYENHLAASSSQPNVINESNSYLLNQVTLMQPKSVVSYKGGCVWPFPHLAPMFGLFPLFAFFLSCLSRQYSLPFLSLPPSPPDSRGPVRKLPATVIDLIKTVNRLKLGQLLCRCRSPDFLLDIIRRQVSPVRWYRILRRHTSPSFLGFYSFLYIPSSVRFQLKARIGCHVPNFSSSVYIHAPRCTASKFLPSVKMVQIHEKQHIVVHF